jgi:hypothetical protein
MIENKIKVIDTISIFSNLTNVLQISFKEMKELMMKIEKENFNHDDFCMIFDYDSDVDNIDIKIEGYRIETDEEYNYRIEQEEEIKERNKVAEEMLKEVRYQEYLKLRKEFEDNDNK